MIEMGRDLAMDNISKKKLLLLSAVILMILPLISSWLSFYGRQIFPNSYVDYYGNHVDLESFQLIDRSTINIYSLEGIGYGRGLFLSDNGLIITAKHILDEMCGLNNSCKDSFIKVSTFSEVASHQILAVDVRSCHRWLDLCFLKFGDSELTEVKFNKTILREGDKAFIMPIGNNSKNDQLKYGKLLTNHSSGLKLDMLVSKGYSGSPTFNSKGEMLGLVFASHFGNYRELPLNIFHSWLGWPNKIYTNNALLIPASDISLLNFCSDRLSEKCFLSELKILKNRLHLFSNQSASHLEKTMFYEMNRRFWLEWIDLMARGEQHNLKDYITMQTIYTNAIASLESEINSENDVAWLELWLLYSLFDRDLMDELDDFKRPLFREMLKKLKDTATEPSSRHIIEAVEAFY